MPYSHDPPRTDCSRLQMTFIEDMRTRLLVPKRAFGNIRKSVGVISDAIGCNLDDGPCGLARATSCSSAADKRQTTWTNDLPFERVRRFELKNLRELFRGSGTQGDRQCTRYLG